MKLLLIYILIQTILIASPKINEFNYLKINAKNNNENIITNFNLSSYKGDSYLTKEENKKTMNKLNKIKSFLKNNKTNFILYFTSESVPKESVTTIIHQVSILQDNKINIETKQYLIGFPEDFKKYQFSFNDYIKDKPIQISDQIRRNYHLKIGPDFFKKLNLKKVPAVAYAQCNNMYPEINTCKIHYLMRGDVNLITFFDKIAETNKSFKEYVKILEANGIYQVEEKDQ